MTSSTSSSFPVPVPSPLSSPDSGGGHRTPDRTGVFWRRTHRAPDRTGFFRRRSHRPPHRTGFFLKKKKLVRPGPGDRGHPVTSPVHVFPFGLFNVFEKEGIGVSEGRSEKFQDVVQNHGSNFITYQNCRITTQTTSRPFPKVQKTIMTGGKVDDSWQHYVVMGLPCISRW